MTAAVLNVLICAAFAAETKLVISGRRPEPELPDSARVGIVERSLLELPAAVSVINRTVLDVLGARRAGQALAAEPSLEENYAPIGYYESFAVRGFVLDNASAFKRNGLTIANEAVMPLENKERMEVLKGAAGPEAGLAAPGGVVDYQTKSPPAAWTRAVTVEGDGTGSRYAHLDFGGPLGAETGLRVNAASESMRPYVLAATGERAFAGLVIERRLGSRADVALDLDWDRRAQHSVPAHQLLGGLTPPPGARPETMLNAQPWRRPVRTEASNVGLRVQVRPEGWGRLGLDVNRNRVLMDDNVAFPYGCSSGTAYSNTFCANGDYDLYDYRSPGEAREVREARASWSGTFKALGVRHRPALALGAMERRVERGQEVFDYVGTANLGAPQPAFAPSSLTPGKSYRTHTYSDVSATLQDKLVLSASWKLNAGVRVSRVSDRRADRSDGAALPGYRSTFLLPRAALSWVPSHAVAVYVAHSQGVELGGTAPATAANAGRILDPKRTRQFEAGLRATWPRRISAAMTLFTLSRPLEFVDAANAFVQRGAATHSGAEASGTYSGAGLRLTAALTLLRTRQHGTGEAAFDGRRPVNVPALSGRVSAASEILPGAWGDVGWRHVSGKSARRDGAASVPGWHVFDMGTRLELGGLGLRVRVENILDRRYWKDVGEAFGDGYLHLGAPRVVRVSLEGRY
jgi:iron complex outermembrane receptor protein